jgi:hypothetical protein
MVERPILFSAPMVLAILAGRKTQTRRIVKHRVTGPNRPSTLDFYQGERWVGACDANGRAGNALALCPYGKRGDRLWVRETFSRHLDGGGVWYWADGNCADRDSERPRPSIHMPRALSRITLEVTCVRVERLWEITDADAQAEGVQKPLQVVDDDPCTRRDAFADLWEEINGPDSWDANPWVWVVEFARLVPQREAAQP